MAKTVSPPRGASFECDECGAGLPKWVGRCPKCQVWGSIIAAAAPSSLSIAAGPVTTDARPIAEVDGDSAAARPTGIGELDRVLGGGLVPGAVVLLAGEPGVGKSTLLLEAATRAAAAGEAVLVVTAEESAAAVRRRAERIGALHPRVWLAAETQLAAVVAHIDSVRPSILIVDSIQTVSATAGDGAAGGLAQVREVTSRLAQLAKERTTATVLVGHVTKEGAVAGPRTLEHLVDVVLYVEGDRHTRLRLIRATKNRYGGTDEIGCFDLAEEGIREVVDPAELFFCRRPEPVAGTCITVASQGRRSLLAEVQALVSRGPTGSPRRATSGLDSARVAMLLAVLERCCRLRLADSDIYTATIGGARIVEPAADLAVALALASAASDRALPAAMAAVGEVGLAGEIRSVLCLERRVAEAARLGFEVILVPPGELRAPPGIEIVKVSKLAAALEFAGVTGRSAARLAAVDGAADGHHRLPGAVASLAESLTG